MANILLMLLLLTWVVCGCEDTLVKTRKGSLRGSVWTSRLGRNFLAFRGIRYAQAPTKDLRFKAPVPVGKWNGVYYATEDPPMCPQIPYENGTSEDCLFLNVYTHGIGGNPRPVIVWLHAGAYVLMSGSSKMRGPDYWMDHTDIVLVTINYRLGALGFLSTNDEHAPGNYGSKDQVQALRWVKENIASFGGNPNDVTLGGYSAGATSVILHMVSPMSRGLFHKAISMSNGALAKWRITDNPLPLAQKQGKLLNCPTESTKDLVNCLKNITDESAFPRIYPSLLERNLTTFDPVVIMTPVVEKDRKDGTERFLIKDPAQSLLEGDFAHVPLLIGSCHDEFAYKGDYYEQGSQESKVLSTYWTDLAPKIFYFEANDKKSKEVWNFYMNKSSPYVTTDGVGKLFSDGIITISTLRVARLIGEKSSQPVFLYLFTYRGEYSHYERGSSVVHQDELIYLFYISTLFPRFSSLGKDAVMTTYMTMLWTNFVTSGHPTPIGQKELDFLYWPQYNHSSPGYLDISFQPAYREGLYFSDRLEFWDRVLPISYTISGMNIVSSNKAVLIITISIYLSL